MMTLGMDPDEIKSLFRTVAGILHFGNIEVKQRPREEWATIPTTTGVFNQSPKSCNTST
jgi:myosin heavy subunit